MQCRLVLALVTSLASCHVVAAETEFGDDAVFIRDAFTGDPSVGVRWAIDGSTLSLAGRVSREEQDFSVGTQTTDRYALTGGWRLPSAITDKLNTFWDLELGYRQTTIDAAVGGDTTLDGLEFGGYYGLEYRFSESFGLEGRAGIVYSQMDVASGGSRDTLDLGRVNVSINYYW